jgi:TolB-like protein
MDATMDALRVVRFGSYEVDLAARELRKRGLRLRLQEKPFQILALLLEKRGQVVTRQELRERLWPPDVYLRFDRSLNTAVNKLRAVLADTAENPRFVETEARKGYRFIAPVTSSGPSGEPPDGSPEIDSIAVLPFRNAGGHGEYLGEGIAESIISALAPLPGIHVMAMTTVLRYKGPEVDARAAGRELGVHAVLTGRLAREGDALTMGAELVDVEKGWRLWGRHYRGPLSNLLAVQEEIAHEVSARLRGRQAAEDPGHALKRYTNNAGAYRDRLHGRNEESQMGY